MNGRLRLYYPLLILLLGTAAYANSFSGAFVFDDIDGIVRNPRIRTLGSCVLHTARPVVFLSYHLNYAADGLRVAGYHLFNLCAHLCAALAFYGILRRTLALSRTLPGHEKVADSLAFVTALLWCVHPLNTAGVTYISQRAESLMGLFFFLTLYCAIRGNQATGRIWTAASVVFCALGMSTKEVMAAAPALVMIYDRIFIHHSWREMIARRWKLYAGLIGACAVVPALMLVARRQDPGHSLCGAISPFFYMLTQFEVICRYLRLSIWPSPLCLDYAWTPAKTVREVWPHAVIILGLLSAVAWSLKRWKPAAFPVIVFFAVLAPTSSLIPLPDCAFEHRMYVPLAGALACCIPAGYAFLSKRSRGWLIALLAATMAAGAAFMTHQRNKDYRTEETIWRDVTRKRPENLRAHSALAVSLSEAGKIKEAMAEYDRALRMIPERKRALLDSGAVTLSGHWHKDAHEYQYFKAHANMGLLMHKELGRSDEAVAHYVAALRVLPGDNDVRAKLKTALRARGIPETDLGREIKALLFASPEDKKEVPRHRDN